VSSFTIGELARAAGVGVETVRFYERRGLLRQPERGEGYRRYPSTDLDRLRFIRRAKDLGFTLAEITGLLDAAGAGAVAELVAATRERLGAVDDDLIALHDRRQRLVQLLDLCADGEDDCLSLTVPTPCDGTG
jgi:MerR family mercuric resistance operon transcriptional regulator